MSERDPHAIAELLAAELGDAALPHARRLVEEFRAAGDATAQLVWSEIVGELILMAGRITQILQ